MQHGQWNVLKIAEPGIDLDAIPYMDRLMLGMSVDRATADKYCAQYNRKYGPRGFEFRVCICKIPFTCDIPVTHATVQ